MMPASKIKYYTPLHKQAQEYKGCPLMLCTNSKMAQLFFGMSDTFFSGLFVFSQLSF